MKVTMHRIVRRLLHSIAVAPVVVLGNNTVLAHPGHGVTDPNSIGHQVVEPVHAIPWMAMIAIGAGLLIVGWKLWPHRRYGR